MDLWIRSQDKSSIYKTTGVYVEKKAYGQKHHYIFTKDEDCLGIYETEKRAMEVLDDIQNLLGTTSNDVSQMVYNMPEE